MGLEQNNLMIKDHPTRIHNKHQVVASNSFYDGLLSRRGDDFWLFFFGANFQSSDSQPSWPRSKEKGSLENGGFTVTAGILKIPSFLGHFWIFGHLYGLVR